MNIIKLSLCLFFSSICSLPQNLIEILKKYDDVRLNDTSKHFLKARKFEIILASMLQNPVIRSTVKICEFDIKDGSAILALVINRPVFLQTGMSAKAAELGITALLNDSEVIIINDTNQIRYHIKHEDKDFMFFVNRNTVMQ